MAQRQIPKVPFPGSKLYKLSGAPQNTRHVSETLAPLLDPEWKALEAVLFHSKEFSYVEQSFALGVKHKGPLVARLLLGQIELDFLKERVLRLGLPEQVCVWQGPPWHFDPKVLVRMVFVATGILLVLQFGVFIYAIFVD